MEVFFLDSDNLNLYKFTCRSVLTILDARLCLESYTSFALDPCLPRIWSSLKRHHLSWIEDQHVFPMSTANICHLGTGTIVLINHFTSKISEQQHTFIWMGKNHAFLPSLNSSDFCHQVCMTSWVRLNDIFDIVRFQCLFKLSACP